MRANAFLVRATLGLVFSLAVAPAPTLAQGSGAIGGTIIDASNAVLPGVSVTLSNPGTIGGNQETVTDARGTYQFTRLVPGLYTVRAALAGFRFAAQENIIVNADATARVDLTLQVGGLEEGIVVRSDAPLLDTTSALNQTAMSRDVLDSLPNRIDVWSIARVVPGVVLARYDVGGSESFLRSESSVHGSAESENGWFIDGMDIAYTGGTGSVPIVYFDPFMYQEANYQTANGPAERSKGGIVYNMITKTGTNTVRGSLQLSGANRDMAFNNVSPELRTQLLASVPARVLAVKPDIEPGADILKMFDSGVSVGGPIVRDRLWYTASAKYSLLDQYRLGSYEPSGAQVLDDNVMRNLAVKLSYQATPNNQVSYLFNWHNKLIGHRTGSTDFFESRALWSNDKYMTVNQAKWTTTLSPDMVMDVGGSLMSGTDPFHPQPQVRAGDIPRFDSVLRNHTVANPNYYDNPGYRGVITASLSRDAGQHGLRAGYQYNRAMIGQEQDDLQSYLPGIRAVFANGVPNSVNTYTTPTSYKTYAVEHALFVQDRWTPTRKLTFNLGLRFETIYAWEPATCRVQTVFVDEQCFDAIEGVPDWKNAAPRFSAVYDLFANGRTAVKFSANRYNNAVGVANLQRLNPISVVNDTRPWADANNDQIPQLSELGASTGYPVGSTNRYSDDLRRPYTNEYSIAIEHQLFPDLVASVGFYRRETRSNIGLRNMAVPADSYIPLTVTEVVTGRNVTVFNQDPSLRGRFDNLWDNSPELDTTFNGVDVTFTKRLSRRWSAMGSLSLGENTGSIYAGTTDLNNPNFALFRRGPVGNDVPVSLKLSGMYQLPYGFTVSASAQHFSGFPENTTVLVNANTVTLTQVSQTLVVEPRGTTRLPAVNAADVSVKKSFQIFGASVEPELGVFNVGNAATILARITQLGRPTARPATS